MPELAKLYDQAYDSLKKVIINNPNNNSNQHYAECICRLIGISFDDKFIALDFMNFKKNLQQRIKCLERSERLLIHIFDRSDFEKLFKSVIYVWATT